MKKLVLLSMSLVMFLSFGIAQEKEKNSGQFGLYFENSQFSWLSLSGIALNFGKNVGNNFRVELAGTYFPLSGKEVDATVVGFSLTGLVKVTNHSRLNIFIGPGFKILGILIKEEKGNWTPGIFLKGMVEYKINNNWGMRAGFTQSVLFPSGDYDEVDFSYMTTGAEWGFFWRF